MAVNLGRLMMLPFALGKFFHQLPILSAPDGRKGVNGMLGTLGAVCTARHSIRCSPPSTPPMPGASSGMGMRIISERFPGICFGHPAASFMVEATAGHHWLM